MAYGHRLPLLVANVSDVDDVALDPLAPIFLYLGLLVRYLRSHKELPCSLRRRAFTSFRALFDLDRDLFDLLRRRDRHAPDRVGFESRRRRRCGNRRRTRRVGRTVHHLDFLNLLSLLVARLGVCWIARRLTFAGGAQGRENADILDHVVGFFVENLLFFLGELKVLAEEGFKCSKLC